MPAGFGDRVFAVANALAIGLLCLVTLYPFYYIVITSLSDPARATIRGLQGPDPESPRVAACAKHFAVHSGPEALRHGFDVPVSPKDLQETYLPAFKASVDAGVAAVMPLTTPSTARRAAPAPSCCSGRCGATGASGGWS